MGEFKKGLIQLFKVVEAIPKEVAHKIKPSVSGKMEEDLPESD
jgi:hypothetical protein